jgi:nucleoside-diphosphate-sugar epimerase
MTLTLITGGAGFIPSCLAERLLSIGHKVVLVDNMLTGRQQNIPEHENCTFIKADANNHRDMSTIMTAYRFDYVFHYAAVVGVQRTLNNPVMVLNDIEGIKIVLDLCKNTGVKRVFYASSSEVYGEPVHLPQHEYSTPLNSRLPYAVVKNVGEAFCRSYYQEYGLGYTIFRFFNTYGPKQSDDFVISRFLKAALHNQDITIYGDGSQSRTFCYIDDNLDTTVAALQDESTINDVLNIGNDRVLTVAELASLVISVTGSSSKIVHLPALPEGDMTRRQPDISKMKQLLERDLLPLRKGLEKILESWNIKKMVDTN